MAPLSEVDKNGEEPEQQDFGVVPQNGLYFSGGVIPTLADLTYVEKSNPPE